MCCLCIMVMVDGQWIFSMEPTPHYLHFWLKCKPNTYPRVENQLLNIKYAKINSFVSVWWKNIQYTNSTERIKNLCREEDALPVFSLRLSLSNRQPYAEYTCVLLWKLKENGFYGPNVIYLSHPINSIVSYTKWLLLLWIFIVIVNWLCNNIFLRNITVKKYWIVIH